MSNTFNKKNPTIENEKRLISSNPVEVDKFVKDPYSGFNVSNQLLYETAYYMLRTSQLKHMKVLNKAMPILFVSGYDDPLGDYGKGILKLANIYRKAGLKMLKLIFITINDMKFYLKKIMKIFGKIYLNG